MTRTRRQSFAWPFCLSMACILSWFIPVEALFGLPAPPNGDPPTFVKAPDPDLTPWIQDYETVFGTYTDGQDVFMHSAAPWDGSSIHLLVAPTGPCLFIPSTEVEITTEVRAGLPLSTAEYFSTMGWLSGPEGVFPTRFAVTSDSDQSMFLFGGLVPASVISDSDFNFDNGAERSEPSVLCTDGIAAFDAADAELHSMLAEEADSKAAAALRMLLDDHTHQVRQCWDTFVLEMEVIEAKRRNAIEDARILYQIDVDAAEATFTAECAAIEVGYYICLAGAAGSTLGFPVVFAICTAAKVAGIAIATGLFLDQKASAQQRFDVAVGSANEQYRLDAIPIKHALEKCLGAINDQFTNEACLYVTLLTFEGRLAIDQHQSAYQALGAEYGECFEEHGGVERLSHGLHIAVATCGFE